MAYFDEKKGEIVLEVEDKEMFEEVKSHFTPHGIKSSQWLKNLQDYITMKNGK